MIGNGCRLAWLGACNHDQNGRKFRMDEFAQVCARAFAESYASCNGLPPAQASITKVKNQVGRFVTRCGCIALAQFEPWPLFNGPRLAGKLGG
jgi:hypothetical protein